MHHRAMMGVAMRLVLAFALNLVRHRSLLVRRVLSCTLSQRQTKNPLRHYTRHSRWWAQLHALDGFEGGLPTREMILASVSCGQSSMKLGRTWPTNPRAARTTEGRKGRLMSGSGSLGKQSLDRPRKRLPAPRITPVAI